MTIKHPNEIYICKECYDTNKIIVILFEGKQYLPTHAGHIYCSKCDEYDTHFNPSKELRKVMWRRQKLNIDEAYYKGVSEAILDTLVK